MSWVATPFALKEGSQLLGQVRESGVYLKEDGTPGRSGGGLEGKAGARGRRSYFNLRARLKSFLNLAVIFWLHAGAGSAETSRRGFPA